MIRHFGAMLALLLSLSAAAADTIKVVAVSYTHLTLPTTPYV